MVGGGSGVGCASALDVAVNVAHKRFGHLSGLLGDAGAKAGSEYRNPSGKHYSATQLQNPGVSSSDFDALYREFGPSWRVSRTPRCSPTRTASPLQLRRLEVPEQGADAGQAHARPIRRRPARLPAKGVTNSALLANCIEDVGATGNKCFARATAGLQGVTGGPQPSSGPPALAGGVSPIGWTRLSAHADADPLLRPSLASAGGRLLATYQAGGLSDIEAASFPASATGIGSISTSDPVAGWRDIDGGPLLFGAPGGGLQMIFSGDHSGGLRDPLNGTSISPLEPGETSAARKPVVAPYAATGEEPNVDAGAVLAADGQTPVWTATSGFSLQLERGARNATGMDLSNLVADQVPHGATLAHDSSGRLWLAWYAQTHNPSTNGQWMLQLDPTGAGPAPGAAPQHAPDSGLSFGTSTDRRSCATVCRIVYKDSSQNRIDLWARASGPPRRSSPTPGRSPSRRPPTRQVDGSG